jgi:hypothetical protein
MFDIACFEARKHKLDNNECSKMEIKNERIITCDDEIASDRILNCGC